MDDQYEIQVKRELETWQKKMLQKPRMLSRLGKRVQTKINKWIPEKVHLAITKTIKQLIRAVLFGAGLATDRITVPVSLREKELIIAEKIESYKKTAAVEGGITGAGGILLGLADFPILIGIKIKLLFDIAGAYGYDTNDYRERIYLLHIFELAFSSDEHRGSVFRKIVDWNTQREQLPKDINEFDWRSFQQEYRDYIDIAKMAQLVPIIGAPVGVIVNYRLIRKLGITAMNAYRMRLL
jgi:hypothetical protein